MNKFMICYICLSECIAEEEMFVLVFVFVFVCVCVAYPEDRAASTKELRR